MNKNASCQAANPAGKLFYSDRVRVHFVSVVGIKQFHFACVLLVTSAFAVGGLLRVPKQELLGRPVAHKEADQTTLCSTESVYLETHTHGQAKKLELKEPKRAVGAGQSQQTRDKRTEPALTYNSRIITSKTKLNRIRKQDCRSATT